MEMKSEKKEVKEEKNYNVANLKDSARLRESLIQMSALSKVNY